MLLDGKRCCKETKISRLEDLCKKERKRTEEKIYGTKQKNLGLRARVSLRLGCLGGLGGVAHVSRGGEQTVAQSTRTHVVIEKKLLLTWQTIFQPFQ